ncbi:hypothetical protein SASPL_129898 [Salvia splendens]|uniref:Uncharacterized protein n=1 Tax=Salvia splendens TaxID=180675 RepID=A0A8X8XFA7_SALSN|nr:hypothetical protein SASPL_129898 [Salvia splendens]
MGVELLEIGVNVRKGAIFTIRSCFRTVCSHPFLVGMLCFLIFLYRSSPFTFHLLLSASPILVCTAVLLGTLLSFGQPNIPEIEVDEKPAEALWIKSGALGDATVVEENGSHFVGEFNRWGEAGKSTEVRREEDSDDTAPLIEASDVEERGGKRELGELRYKKKDEWIEERLYNGDATVNGEVVGSDEENSEADSFDSEKVNVDSVDSPPLSPWARVKEPEEKEEDKEQDEDEEDGSDSESDCAESSSPDASMADIMPMLDELHPLLDEEGGPQNARFSCSNSDIASDKSLKSSHQSDDESEDHERLEAADDENEDGDDDEEDDHGDKDEETKSTITWTEQDQKNLMDVGCSEIERNQRLENLILRRRARKSTSSSFFAERNLIDLECTALPFNIAPILTRRQNPFDLPQDSCDDSGLPPIPGSAPSVLLQRSNPFDIPYDSSEEKPDLNGDVFQEEFTSQLREPFFRRHESFSVRPSLFAPKRQDIKMRPYFVPERTISEESSSYLFQRQSSGLSDSKASSIPETESITSVEDMEDKKLPETDCLPEREVVEQSRDIVEEGPPCSPKLITLQEVDSEEIVFKMESVSEHIGHGSQSSEDDCLEFDHIEKRDDQVGESHLVDVTECFELGRASQYAEGQGFGHGSTLEAVESRYSRHSSSSSLSEVNERVFIDKESEGLSMVEGNRDVEEPSVSNRTSVLSNDPNITSSLAIELTQRVPVYDSSLQGLRESLICSSVCDVLPAGVESEGSHWEIETNTEMLPDSSVSQSAAADSRAVDFFDIKDHDNVNTDLSLNSASTSSASDAMDKHILDEVSVSFDDKNIDGIVEVSETQLEGLPRTESSNSVDSDTDNQHGTDEKLVSTLSSEGNTSLFYESVIQELDYNSVNVVQASNTQVETSSDYQSTHDDLNMPEVQELDHYVNSPSNPKFVSILQSAMETNSYRFHLQTVVEEVDEIKEIDEGLLCELDNVGDFSIGQLGSGTSEFEKRVESVGEGNLSSTHYEVNRTEHVPLPGELREHIDLYEQDGEFTSEIQARRAENIEVSKVDENDPDSPHQEISDDDTPCRENEFLPANSSVNDSHEDAVSGIQEIKVQSVENVSVVATKPEIAEVPCQGELDTDSTSGMPEIEASSVENIDLTLKQTSSKNRVVLDPPRDEIQNHEDSVSAIPVSEALSVDDVDAAPKRAESMSMETKIMVEAVEVSSYEMTEAKASTVEDIELAFKQLISEEPRVLESVDADTPSLISELEASKIKDDYIESLKISSTEIEKQVLEAELHDCEDRPEQEVFLAEDVPKHTELASVETEVVVESVDTSSQDRIHTEDACVFTEIEANTVEEMDLAFEQIMSKAIEIAVDVKPVDSDSTSEMPEIEASSVEAIHRAFQHTGSSEIKDHDIGETITDKTAPHGDASEPVSTNQASLIEVGPCDDAEANDKQTADSKTPVVDPALPLVESKEMQGASSELHVAEDVPLESKAPPTHVSDDETSVQLELKSDDESVEVKADDNKIGPCDEKSSSLSSAIEGEKPNHGDNKAVKDSDSPSSGKGKAYKTRHPTKQSNLYITNIKDNDMLLQASVSRISGLRAVFVVTCKTLQLRTFESGVVLKAANTKDKSTNLQNQFEGKR